MVKIKNRTPPHKHLILNKS